MRLRHLAIVASAAMAIASPALACPTQLQPPVEGGETNVSAVQAEMWDAADLVFVARVEESRTKSFPGFPDGLQVSLMPLTWLKGQAGPWQFELTRTGMATCGPMPGFDAVGGKPGDTFVIFVKGDTPVQEAVKFTVKLSGLVEPRALAALKAQELARG